MRQITVTKSAARRFLIRAFALDGFQILPDVQTALTRLPSVQMDSINIVARMHDLILWPRVREYAPHHLHDELYTRRAAFEYYFPNLCVLPVAVYPYFVRTMRERQNQPGRWHALTDDEKAVADGLLAQMDGDGAIRSRFVSPTHGHTQSGWGTKTKVASHVLEKLWLHGIISTHKRVNFERHFDRTERLYPHLWNLHAPGAQLPTPEAEAYMQSRLRLQIRRLFRLTKEAKAYMAQGGEIIRVQIEDVKREWYILADDADALQSALSTPMSPILHLLAPLDPLVYDRDRLKDLWDFDYTWEVYVPAAKRKWGYYVLPVLHGETLVARLDPHLNRIQSRLTVRNLLWECPPTQEQREILSERIGDFARFTGAETVEYADDVGTIST